MRVFDLSRSFLCGDSGNYLAGGQIILPVLVDVAPQQTAFGHGLDASQPA
jgi:hypothetical protein